MSVDAYSKAQAKFSGMKRELGTTTNDSEYSEIRAIWPGLDIDVKS